MNREGDPANNRPNNDEAEIPPEFWEGHGFEDTCRYSQQYPDPSKTISLVNAFRDLREPALREDEERRKKVAKEVLDRTMTGNLVVAQTIPEGEVFNGEDFPEGTLVRFRETSTWRNSSPFITWRDVWDIFVQRHVPASLSRWEKPERFSDTMLGVVTDSTYYPRVHSKRLIFVTEWAYRRNFMRARDLDHEMRARIEVGKVIHTRTRHDPLGISMDDELEKITQFEILRIEPTSTSSSLSLPPRKPSSYE